MGRPLPGGARRLRLPGLRPRGSADLERVGRAVRASTREGLVTGLPLVVATSASRLSYDDVLAATDTIEEFCRLSPVLLSRVPIEMMVLPSNTVGDRTAYYLTLNRGVRQLDAVTRGTETLTASLVDPYTLAVTEALDVGDHVTVTGWIGAGTFVPGDTLTAALTAADNDPAAVGLPTTPGSVVRIDSELLVVVEADRMDRGEGGTEPAIHSAGAAFSLVQPPAALKTAALAIARRWAMIATQPGLGVRGDQNGGAPPTPSLTYNLQRTLNEYVRRVNTGYRS